MLLVVSLVSRAAVWEMDRQMLSSHHRPTLLEEE
jgi:hypothetical protein